MVVIYEAELEEPGGASSTPPRTGCSFVLGIEYISLGICVDCFLSEVESGPIRVADAVEGLTDGYKILVPEVKIDCCSAYIYAGSKSTYVVLF